MKTGVVISVAGCGSRIGPELPKQFRQLGDKRVVDHTLNNIFATGCFDDVVLVVRPGDRPEYENYWGRCVFVDGDPNNGQNSRRLGLLKLKELGYEDDDLVALADGNRPLIDSWFYKKLIDDAKIYGNSLPYLIQKDIPLSYIDGVSGKMKSRDFMIESLTPPVFPFKIFLDAYNNAYDNGTLDTTEGAVSVLVDEMTRLGKNKEIHYVEGNAKYFKITTIDDLEMARLIVKGLENSDSDEDVD